jgi:alpha-tubulin suppressor-like RCC1 family protein
MPAASTTVTANYAAIPTYTLTVVNGTGSGSYTAGTVINIVANPAPANMVFNSWSGTPVTLVTSPVTTLTMPAATTTVAANYSAAPAGSYTVTYATTGSTAGRGPSDPNQYSPGQPVLVPGNTGYLFNPNHSSIGWNTAPDGSGTSYAAGSTLTMGTSGQTLYPQWNTQNWPVSVWGGARAAILLKADGSVLTWGMNSNGQLGNGTTTDSPLPVQVLGTNAAGNLTGVTAIMGGEEHNVALKSDGTVWAWGMNAFNQLGNGGTADSATPVQVSGLTSVVALGARAYHTLAIKSDGTVWSWGNDKYGALGIGVNDSRPDYPIPVQVPGLSNPLMVTAGYGFSLALMSDHTLMAWGDNSNGQIGDGTNTSRYTPVPVQGIDHVIQVSAGWNHSVAIKSDGTVWTWGENTWIGVYPGVGKLGNGTTADSFLPTQVPGLAGAIQASAGDSFTAVLLRDGTVWTFGANGAGQLGTGSFTVQSLLPVQVQGLNNVVSLTARDHHAQAIRNDGTVWSWGSGQNGELGNGTTQNSAIPVQVTLPGSN